MKHAILITAYKDWEYLSRLVSCFNENFNVYIHIDAKSHLPLEREACLRSFPFVRSLCRAYSVNWGGMNHVRAVLQLCQLALADKENQMFHLISGQDVLTQPAKCLLNLNCNYSYLENFPLPAPHWTNGGEGPSDVFSLVGPD